MDLETRFAAMKAQAIARRASFDLAARREALRALRGAIKRHEAEIIAAIGADFGKPQAEVILTEILPVLIEIDHALRHLRRWMRPRRVRPVFSSLGTSARIRPEPRGLALILSPWNYPFSLAISPLVSALAAGNGAVVKPSELTPATSALTARIVAEALPADLATVIEGGKVTAQALLDLPFDHIFFTGSPEVGRIVMQKAARHLASVTLELGGKSPTIVGPGADVEAAARWIAFGKFANAGQTCIAPDHVFVHESLHQPFVAALRAQLEKTYGTGAASPHLARVIDAAHAARLTAMVDEARAGGARLLMGSGTAEGERLAPTLIEALTPDMALEQEEIFGPVLPILPFRGLSEVIARINARPKPLALYLFETDHAMIERVIAETSSGSVAVNLTVAQYSHPGLPFGGVNASGIGTSHGEHGFRSFSHERAILTNRFSPIPLLFPPYTGRKQRLLARLRRWIG
ncbi:MAG TPA: aldehyde dehydrogenase family protein [Rhodobacterales bacterium]|nr:aldehyde dehydrogenase family protein [Rhodobacterales bacterium]